MITFKPRQMAGELIRLNAKRGKVSRIRCNELFNDLYAEGSDAQDLSNFRVWYPVIAPVVEFKKEENA